ncbi:hypothetical protein TNCV_3682111 [Trichonephila clavipes]|uniref:Uncharacterized protein n=1 Tax=Trichonephila clavipes TaxID=2585209 RepID=A0A8X6RBJ7_TRICX|nr:hypothetical protein TNCV_3682111 [Trichonephila clavipes]
MDCHVVFVHKLQCPFNQHRLKQTLFTGDSFLATNTVSQSSENSVSSQQIPNSNTPLLRLLAQDMTSVRTHLIIAKPS